MTTANDSAVSPAGRRRWPPASGARQQPASPSHLHPGSTAPSTAAAYRGYMTDQDNANENDDLFTTETAGLPQVLRPAVTRLGDGDRLDLRIGPVRKNIDGAEPR